MIALAILLVFTLLSATAASPLTSRIPLSVLPTDPEYQTHFDRLRGVPYSVSYDDRAILVNGERVLLLSGSIHYPRFAEAEWGHQMNLTRIAGLNMSAHSTRPPPPLPPSSTYQPDSHHSHLRDSPSPLVGYKPMCQLTTQYRPPAPPSCLPILLLMTNQPHHSLTL